MQDELFLAWAAGFFDGEGCVIVELSESKACQFGYRTSLHATVTQTSVECLQKFKDAFGGSIKTYEFTCPNSTRWAVQYTWTVRNENAIKFLNLIYKHSVVKKEQIKVAIQYPLYAENGKKFGNVNKMPEHVWQKRLDIRKNLKDIRASMKTMAKQRHEVKNA